MQQGTLLVIGNGFIELGTTKCQFSDIITNGVAINSTTISCTIPAVSSYGQYPVSISLDGKSYTNDLVVFQYL